jgi:TPR repeat protein
MKCLNCLRATVALIALPFGVPLALATALVSTSATAQEDAKPKQTAEEWLQEYNTLSAAADEKLTEVLTSMVLKEAMADYEGSNFSGALPKLKRVAIEGSGFHVTVAQFLLGQMYENGLGVEANESQAVGYYTLAGAAGWADASYNLGNIYYKNGNYSNALKEFRSFLANPESGDKADAHYKLGMLYNLGNGITQDHALAAAQFALADIGKGNNNARYELGMLYLKGKGVGQDFSSAAKYLQKAAIYNRIIDLTTSPDAQYALSTLYAEGKGVTQSDDEAVKFLRMAAKEDHIKAQFGLGMMYAAGRGVPQSMPIAYLWIARAAEGDAAFRSYSQTTKTALAYTNGTAEAVKARDAIRARMTPEQITDAQVMVDRCVRSNYACNWGE